MRLPRKRARCGLSGLRFFNSLNRGGSHDPVTRSDRVKLSDLGLGKMDSSRDQMLAQLPVERLPCARGADRI